MAIFSIAGMAIDDAEEELLFEAHALRLAERAAQSRLKTLQQRELTFWKAASDAQEDDALRLAAQQQVWAEQRAMHEQACMHPLSTCVAELRRWQGVQRAAHERTCNHVRGRRELEEGDLQCACAPSLYHLFL